MSLPRCLNLVGKQCILFRGFKGRAQLRIAPYKGLPPSQGMVSTSSEKRGDLPCPVSEGGSTNFSKCSQGLGEGLGVILSQGLTASPAVFATPALFPGDRKHLIL